MLSTQPIVIKGEPSATWQVNLLTSGEPFRASSLLATNGIEIAVFDTGLPQHSGSFLAALASFGVSPDSVTLVFNTHSHIDHSHNNVLFNNAKIFCSRLDRDWTTTFHEALAVSEDPIGPNVQAFYPEIPTSDFDPKIMSKVFSIEKKVWDPRRWGNADQFRWIEEVELPEGVKVLATPGHVPHHVSFVIDTGFRPVLLCGDALLTQDEENSNISLIPPVHLADYKHSQTVINAFDGIIVPGHDVPFDNAIGSQTPR
jgi:glyoxylase-like metal-dependent hydrolase (beta-lactamase superfamily II)